MNTRDDVDLQSGAVHRRDAARIVRLVVVVAIIVALVLVGMDNREDVRLGYVFGDAEAPIWVVILLAAVAGAVIGWLVRHRPRHRD